MPYPSGNETELESLPQIKTLQRSTLVQFGQLFKRLGQLQVSVCTPTHTQKDGVSPLPADNNPPSREREQRTAYLVGTIVDSNRCRCRCRCGSGWSWSNNFRRRFWRAWSVSDNACAFFSSLLNMAHLWQHIEQTIPKLINLWRLELVLGVDNPFRLDRLNASL